jgi:hypothetical protein
MFLNRKLMRHKSSTNKEPVVEGVVAGLLHVVPSGHDAVLDGVLEGQDIPLGLGLVANVGVLLALRRPTRAGVGPSPNAQASAQARRRRPKRARADPGARASA